MAVPKDIIRATINIPAPLYRKLKRQAADLGCSVQDLIMNGIQQALLNPRRPRTRPVRFPLIDSEGPRVELTNERLHELIAFP